jgi:hypothetical protein
MSDWLHNLPLPWMTLVVLGATYLFTGGIYLVVVVLAVGDRTKVFKGISPGMLPPLGIVFGLFVAFAASQAWSDNERANTAVNREAGALSSVVFLSSSFPGEPEAHLRDLVRRYIQESVDLEWPTLARSKGTGTLPITPHALGEALNFTLALTARSPGQITAQREIASALENAVDARRQRIIISRSRFSWLKWACLLLQAACTLVAIAMVHSDNRRTCAIAMAIFSTGVAVSVLLIIAHNRPFTGRTPVRSDLLRQVMPEEEATQKEIDHTIALHLATLLRSARQVISDHQDLINEKKTGKGLTGQRILQEAKANYARTTGHALPTLDPTSLEGMMLQAEEEAIQEVVDQAQPLINDPTRGFKGFLPAVFAYRVADVFRAKVKNHAYLKLTAPAELIRHQENAPDAWESSMIKSKFQSPGWTKGQYVEAEGELNGRKAYRLLIPEYYEASCLACHGEPKGEKDITGWMKEGGKSGDVGGAISAAIYLK